jgi:hypothetical protein
MTLRSIPDLKRLAAQTTKAQCVSSAAVSISSIDLVVSLSENWMFFFFFFFFLIVQRLALLLVG